MLICEKVYTCERMRECDHARPHEFMKGLCPNRCKFGDNIFSDRECMSLFEFQMMESIKKNE